MRVGEVALELEDVADRRAAERVDRLVGVAHHAQLAGLADQLLDQRVLRVVGVLVFVDEHVLEALPVFVGDLGVRPEEVDRRHDEVVEVERVGLAQPALIERVDLGDGALLGTDRPGREALGVDQLVFQVGDLPGQRPRRVALGVEVELAGDQLQQPAGVVGVVDRERRAQAGHFVLGAQDAHARRVERGHPHQPGPPADQLGHPLLHLAGGLVGERDRDDLGRVNLAGGQQVSDPVGQHPGLAGAGAGHDQQGRPSVDNRVALRAVEALEQVLGVAAGTTGSAEFRRELASHGRVYADPPTVLAATQRRLGEPLSRYRPPCHTQRRDPPGALLLFLRLRESGSRRSRLITDLPTPRAPDARGVFAFRAPARSEPDPTRNDDNGHHHRTA